MNILSNKVKDYLYAAFAFSIALLLGVGYISYLAIQQNEESVGWLIHSQQVLTQSERVYSEIKDAQRAQRGYLLTADTLFLAKFATAGERIYDNLNNLQRLTADNPVQQERLEELGSIIPQAFLYWDRSIVLKQNGEHDAAVDLVRKGEGRILIERAGIHISEFQQHEQMLLKQRQAEYISSRRLRNLLEIGGIVLAVILLSLAFMVLRRLLLKEQQLNASLEARVEQRTAELNKILDDLKKSNEELDGFVYTASHDLRTPVINLQGLQQVLKRSMTNNTTAKQEEYLHLMDTSIVRLNRTITELADIAKITRENLQSENLSISAVFQDVLLDLGPLVERTDATIKTNFQLDQINYPYAHLRSVLYNLVSNAIKYHAPDRAPYVRLRTFLNENGRSCLEVKDNGLGLDAGQVSRLFTLYKRYHTHVEGSGVGLSMIKRIVENQGGSIQVNSMPGQGSTFTVVL